MLQKGLSFHPFEGGHQVEVESTKVSSNGLVTEETKIICENNEF